MESTNKDIIYQGNSIISIETLPTHLSVEKPASRIVFLPKGEQLTFEVFEKYFEDQNIDAVLVAVETGKSTKETAYGGGTSYVSAGFRGFYISTSPIYQVPSYLSEETIIYMDTKLFETKEGKTPEEKEHQTWDVKRRSKADENPE